jgi:hypothetical protein
MRDSLVELMDAICPQWRDVFVGVATDREPKMTGKVQGLATLVEKETTATKEIRVWCGLHQLDLMMGRVHEESMGGTFQSTLTAVIGHLRRQQTLITRMRTTCPKVAGTRWMSMFHCTSWFTTNITVTQEHFKTRTLAPKIISDTTWWVFLFAVHSLNQEDNTGFTKLQGMTTHLSQQSVSLEKLVTTYCIIPGKEGPFSAEVIERLDEEERLGMETHSGFCLRHSATEAYLVELAPWIETALTVLTQETKSKLLASVAKMFVMTAGGVQAIVAERNSDNSEGEELPPVLPHQQVQLKMTELNRLIEAHRGRLQTRLQLAAIHQIGQDLVQLRRMYRHDETFRAVIEQSSCLKTTFVDGWAGVGSLVPSLQQFCGEIASAFPNTATFESDFSILGWEKNSYRACLTDFSLEEILHAK